MVGYIPSDRKVKGDMSPIPINMTVEEAFKAMVEKYGLRTGDEIDDLCEGGSCLLCESDEDWEVTPDQQNSWEYECGVCGFRIKMRSAAIITELHMPPHHTKQWRAEQRETEHGVHQQLPEGEIREPSEMP